jgi:hypothetical protein
MKKLIITSMMILTIYCTVESCRKETDQSKCQSHTMESGFNFLSCYKYEVDGNPHKCWPLFTSDELQKTYVKYARGINKEFYSVYQLSVDDDSKILNIFDKETYSRDDIIKMKGVKLVDSLTEKDKNIMKSNNTCMYRSYARFLDVDLYYGNKQINVSDKNVCFNADKFDDLKDLMNCGYYTVKAEFNNTSFVFTNCFRTLDRKADSDFKKYYLKLISKSILLGYINRLTYIAFDAYVRDNNHRSHLNYSQVQILEAVVEDEYGKIIKYNGNGDIIEGGYDVDDDEPKKILSSSKNRLNILLLLCLSLFLC